MGVGWELPYRSAHEDSSCKAQVQRAPQGPTAIMQSGLVLLQQTRRECSGLRS